jgi:hypothetical protein
MPRLLFADSPLHDEPEVRAWELEGKPGGTVEVIQVMLDNWIQLTGASQIGISVPLGGDEPGVLLVTLDEQSVRATQTYVSLDDGEIVLSRWHAASAAQLPTATWQLKLASNAGYDDFAKFRCEHCGSVCPGESDEVPSPCDYCGSTEIVQVSLTTPLAPPCPPYDADYVPECAELLATPFMMTLIDLIYPDAEA